MTWPWDLLTGAVDTLEAIVAIPWAMADIAVQLLLCLIYPVVALVDIAQGVINQAIAPPLELINVLIGIPNLVITIINLLFVGVFPSVWIGLVVGMVLLVLGLRLYAIVKGASIFGWGL